MPLSPDSRHELPALGPTRRQWVIRAGALVSAVLALSACAWTQPAPAIDRGVNPAVLDRFMDRVAAEAQAGIVPGAVLLVARDGKVLYRRSVGRLSPDQTAAMPTDAIFRIYSMTKPIVSVATLMLAEEGKLALSDPASRYLPELKGLQVGVEKPGPEGKPVLERVPAQRELTVHDLLRHMSGLTYSFFGSSLVKTEYQKAGVVPGAPGNELDNAELIRRLAKLPLAHQPGSTWDYSISTDVLGALIERVEGQPLDQVLQRRILGPLRMKDTAFSVPAAQHHRIAEPFATDPDTKAPVKLLEVRTAPKLLAGGAGLVSTADDYARFAQMLANGGTLDGVRILSRQSVQWMTHDHTGGVRGPMYNPGPGYGFGLGVAVRLSPGQSTLPGNTGDFHWGGAAGTFWWHDPSQGLVAVWMIQGPGRSGYFRPHLRNAVYQSLD